MARAARVARASSLHPCRRGSLEREHRKRVFRWPPIQPQNVAQYGRFHSARLGNYPRAAISRLASLAALRVASRLAQHRESVRPKMTAVTDSERVYCEAVLERADEDLPYFTTAAYESGDRVPSDAMRELLSLALDLRSALTQACNPWSSRPQRNSWKAAPYMGWPRLAG